MPEVPIDMDYLCFAYEDDSPDNLYYLDTKLGDVRLVNRSLSDLRDLTDEVEKSEGRFLYVPKRSRELVLEDLNDFHASVEDKDLQRVLTVAFDSPHVEETFKQILAKKTDHSERLKSFLAVQTRARVMKWLTANAIVPTVRTV